MGHGMGQPELPQKKASQKVRKTRKNRWFLAKSAAIWLRGPDLNRRPSGYEPDELPNCSTPRYCSLKYRDYYSTEPSYCQEEISNFCAISRKNAICSTCNSIHACFFRTRCATLIAFFKMHSQSVSTGSREFGEFPTIEKQGFRRRWPCFWKMCGHLHCLRLVLIVEWPASCIFGWLPHSDAQIFYTSRILLLVFDTYKETPTRWLLPKCGNCYSYCLISLSERFAYRPTAWSTWSRSWIISSGPSKPTLNRRNPFWNLGGYRWIRSS